MAAQERRPLIEGLKDNEGTTARGIDSAIVKHFVFGDDKEPSSVPERVATTPVQPAPRRQTLSTRIREDFGQALKRASLERQLAGVAPNTVQDILEEAIEPWLREHGYLA